MVLAGAAFISFAGLRILPLPALLPSASAGLGWKPSQPKPGPNPSDQPFLPVYGLTDTILPSSHASWPRSYRDPETTTTGPIAAAPPATSLKKDAPPTAGLTGLASTATAATASTATAFTAATRAFTSTATASTAAFPTYTAAAAATTAAAAAAKTRRVGTTRSPSTVAIETTQANQAVTDEPEYWSPPPSTTTTTNNNTTVEEAKQASLSGLLVFLTLSVLVELCLLLLALLRRYRRRWRRQRQEGAPQEEMTTLAAFAQPPQRAESQPSLDETRRPFLPLSSRLFSSSGAEEYDAAATAAAAASESAARPPTLSEQEENDQVEEENTDCRQSGRGRRRPRLMRLEPRRIYRPGTPPPPPVSSPSPRMSWRRLREEDHRLRHLLHLDPRYLPGSAGGRSGPPAEPSSPQLSRRTPPPPYSL